MVAAIRFLLRQLTSSDEFPEEVYSYEQRHPGEKKASDKAGDCAGANLPLPFFITLRRKALRQPCPLVCGPKVIYWRRQQVYAATNENSRHHKRNQKNRGFHASNSRRNKKGNA